MPVCVAFACGSTARNAARDFEDRLAQEAEWAVTGRVGDLFKLERHVNELVKNPTFREEMRLKAQRRLDMERDWAFREMDRGAGRYAIRCGGGHVFLREWREKVSSELQQLRETERRSREFQREKDEPFVAARINLTCEITSAGESYISNMSGQLLMEDDDYDPPNVSKILPITTPADFARDYQVPPVIPGQRFSFNNEMMPRIRRCRPEHNDWLTQCVRLGGPVKGSSSHDDPQSRDGIHPWTRLASLMWRR